MDMLGENFVMLKGKVHNKKLEFYGNNAYFRSSIAVPINEKFQYIKISTWGELAERLGELPNGTWIKVYGHIEESSYACSCKYCNGEYTAYWTNVAVDNFTII